jgi:hypothetical protein
MNILLDLKVLSGGCIHSSITKTMKHIYALFVLILISALGSKAQMPIEVSDVKLKVGSSEMPGLSVTIPEVDYEKTLKDWTKMLESGTRSNVVQENNEMSIFGANIKDISDDPVNVYSVLTNADSVLTLQAAFELKKDEFIERTVNDENYAKARKVVFDFAKNQYIDLASEQLKEEEKKLRSLESELSSLERDQVRMEKSTRSNKQLIAEEREKIELLNNELVSLSTEILGQSNKQGSMASGEVAEQSSDYIKDLEKQKKKVSKDLETSERKISKAEKEIEDNQRETPQNTNLQESAREEVSRQEAIVQGYTEKLNAIKDFK